MAVSRNLSTLLLAFSLIHAFAADTSNRLECNAAFQKTAGKGWAITHWGQSIREVSFRIDRINSQLVFSDVKLGEPTGHHIDMPVTPDTIAVWHNHTALGSPLPSAKDMESPVPNYVQSQGGLYVTIPGTKTYKKLEPCQKQ